MKEFCRRHRVAVSFSALFAAALIYLLFCLINIESSVWFDESFTGFLIRGDFGDIASLTASDVHPPLFYWALKVWSLLFGTTDFALRFMSVFFGLISIALAFYLVRRHFGLKPAVVTALLLAVCPMLIRYGQEMRMYTMVLTIVLAATYALDLAISTKKLKWWLLYGVLLALGMWTHYFVAFAWLAHLAFLIYHYRKHIFQKNIIIAYVLAVLLFLPWLPQLIHQTVVVQSGFWIPAVSLNTPFDFLAGALIFSTAEYSTGWLAVLLIVVVIFTTLAFRSLKKRQILSSSALKMLVALIVIPPAVLFAVSLPPLRSMFVDRYILYSAVAIWVLLAILLACAQFGRLCPHHPRRANLLRAGFTLSLVICAVVGIVNVEERSCESDIKGLVTDARAAADTSTTISEEDGSTSGVVPILASTEYTYYDAVFYDSEDTPVWGTNDFEFYYGSYAPIKEYQYHLAKSIDAFLGDHDTFWYLIDNSALSDYQGDSLPAPFSDYRVSGTISGSLHTLLQFSKK